MGTYATDTRSEQRLTRVQVDALDLLSGNALTDVDGLISRRTLASLVKRGLVYTDGTLTPTGQDVLYAYI